MLWALITTEYFKIRKTRILSLLFISPVFAGVVGFATSDLLSGSKWLASLLAMSVTHSLLLLPLIIGVLSSFICRYEHLHGGWKQLLSLPVRREEVARNLGERAVLRLALLEHAGRDAIDLLSVREDRDRQGIDAALQPQDSSRLHREVRIRACRKQVCGVDVETVAPRGFRLTGVALVGRGRVRSALLELRENRAVLSNHHFPFEPVPDDVGFVDDLAIHGLLGDVLELGANQFALNRVLHRLWRLADSHLGFL